MNKKTIAKKQKKNHDFNGSTRDYLMRHGNFSCGFNMPDALEGETTFGLPPYAKRMPFLVDEYPACPNDWMRSEGRIKSFFVPVVEGKGMWLDFNENETSNNYHLAIVISIQGINPITGLPCNDPQLEQYIDECPKHKKKFGPNRHCKECGFNWPKQNYLCTTGTPSGSLWLDGFKSAEGVVRQYLLTAEKMRGVASNIIGKDRVFAIGVSFFLSKEKKPTERVVRGITQVYHTHVNSPIYGPPQFFTSTSGEFMGDWDCGSGKAVMDSCEISCNSLSPSSLSANASSGMGGAKGKATNYMRSLNRTKKQLASTPNDPKATIVTHHAINVQAKKLEVGAGAKIIQSVYDDPERLDFWHDEPESIICITIAQKRTQLR